jgi:hypothetical protein
LYKLAPLIGIFYIKIKFQTIWVNIWNTTQDISKGFGISPIMMWQCQWLVKSKSILSYEIADSGLQLNVITYCYKKCKCSEIYKNNSYHLIIFINILQLQKDLHRQVRWDVSAILACILLSFREVISYNMSVYFSIHNICINFFSRWHTIHYSALILLGGLAFNIHFIHCCL